MALVAPSIFASVAIFNSSSSVNELNFEVTEADTSESMQFIVARRFTVVSPSSLPSFAPVAVAVVAVDSTTSTSTMLASTPTTSAVEDATLSSSAGPKSLALKPGPEKLKSKVTCTSSFSVVEENEHASGSDKPHVFEHDPHVKLNADPSYTRL